MANGLFPLPSLPKGKKWAVRWRNTRKGAFLPRFISVNTDEPTSGWEEGFPKNYENNLNSEQK